MDGLQRTFLRGISGGIRFYRYMAIVFCLVAVRGGGARGNGLMG